MTCIAEFELSNIDVFSFVLILGYVIFESLFRGRPIVGVIDI